METLFAEAAAPFFYGEGKRQGSGVYNGDNTYFPEELAAEEGQKQAGDICCTWDVVDPWYLKLPAGKVDFLEEQKVRFYCWRRDRYVPKEKVDWNLMKMPLL